MGVQVTRLKTQAETQLAEQFAALGEVSPERNAAFARFEAIGLPHKRVEAYHFTDVRAALREALPLAGTPAREAIEAARRQMPPSTGECRIVSLDGHFIKELSSELPPGVDVAPNAGSQLALTPADPMFEIIQALRPQGVFIIVHENAVLEHPIHLIHLLASGSPACVVTQDVVAVHSGATVTVLESWNAGAARGQVHAATAWQISDGARVTHVLQADDFAEEGFFTQMALLGKNVQFDSTALISGGRLTRRQIFLTFNGEHSTASLNGVTLLRGGEHADTTLTVTHAAPHCTSRETFRHIIDNEATGVFQGKIIVKPGAQKTDGKMMSKAVLLAETGIMNNKPELEIFADDVVCGHGATVGALDEDQLFYAMQRGIPRAEAEALLLEAFAGEVLDTISHEATREMMLDHLRNWLAERTKTP